MTNQLTMAKHDFLVPVVDTDSITVCKKDGAPFTPQEIETLTAEINSLHGELIDWDLEFYIDKIIALKAKNYILFDSKAKEDKRVKIKGSGLKSSKTEPAIKDYHGEIIQAMLDGTNNYTEIYQKYVAEITNVTDITRWCSKKTITKKVFESDRENEAKVVRAIAGSEYVEGDKPLFFYLPDGELCLSEKFDGIYDKAKLYKRLFDSSKIFANVIDIKAYFLNYSLKKNLKLLT